MISYRRHLIGKPVSPFSLSVDNTPQARLRIDTHSGVGCLVNWGDGNSQMLPSGSSLTHVYATNYTGDVLVTPLGGYSDISKFESTGSTAWNFDLSVFVPLTGLTNFSLDDLPNANITGDLISFLGNTGLTYFWIFDLPNANITGSLNSFTGATGLTVFNLESLPNANITGSINSFSGATGLDYFQLFNLPNANIDGSLNSFSNATELTVFILYNLPNANIVGSLNSFIGATWLTDFYLYNVPNANITGSLNSFTGATGLVNLWLYPLHDSSNITGDSSAVSNKTNLRDFLIFISPTSTITINYDDILNIWQSSVYIIHRSTRPSGASGISAIKATTSSFNFDSIRSEGLYFQNIGLSTQSKDNMIIALNNSLIVQTGPKTIYINQNASHSGSPAVMTALSGLASKNITVVL